MTSDNLPHSLEPDLRSIDTIHSLFDAVAQSSPDAVAVIENRHWWSYGDLRRRSVQLAGRIREEGVCAGDLVAVHASRSFELIAALLAILRSGATYVPLHPGHPPGWKQGILQTVAPRLLLHDGSLSGDWAAGLTRPIDLRDSGT